MGCDAYADVNGLFWVDIYSYDADKFIKRVYLPGLMPRERLKFNMFNGEMR